MKHKTIYIAFLAIIFSLTSCSTNNINYCSGHAIGIMGCYDVNGEYQRGVFIVTDNKDSLLSFNGANYFYEYIEEDLIGGPYVRVSSITRMFQFSYLEPKDTIQWIPPLSNTMELWLNNEYRYKQIKYRK